MTAAVQAENTSDDVLSSATKQTDSKLKPKTTRERSAPSNGARFLNSSVVMACASLEVARRCQHQGEGAAEGDKG